MDETIRKFAIQKGDEHIIAVKTRDIVVAEDHYHTSCYKNYTRNIKNKTESEKGNGINENQEVYGGDLYQIIEK